MKSAAKISRPPHRRRLVTLGLLLTSLIPAVAEPATPGSDPKAMEIAGQVMEALGGEAAWDATRYLRFDFVVEDADQKALSSRTHWWDKQRGMHRIEGRSREGQSYLVLHDLESREGTVWVDGSEVTDALEAKSWLDRAYAAWINDTYWLLMPYKMRDPGVMLRYEGQREIDGTAHDMIHVSFDQVGLTPGDQYWATIDPTTHQMERWAYVLEGNEPPPVEWRWTPWKQYGQILLATERIPVEGERRIVFRNLAVPEAVPESVFESPEPVELTTIVIRAISRDAKIIGSNVGGARITVREIETGSILAGGLQEGGTGSTDAIIRAPRTRGQAVFDTPGAAEFRAVLALSRPTTVEIEAVGPLGTPQSTQRVTKTLLLVPGADILGDGVLLEIHGFTVEIQEPFESAALRMDDPIPVRVRLTMT